MSHHKVTNVQPGRNSTDATRIMPFGVGLWPFPCLPTRIVEEMEMTSRMEITSGMQLFRDHFHACQHKLSRKWKWPQEWKWLQECNWRNNFVFCHTKQECQIYSNPSCWCLLQKWNTLERTQTRFLRFKPQNLLLSQSLRTLWFLFKVQFEVYKGIWPHFHLRVLKNLEKWLHRHRVSIHHLGKARGEVQCRHPGF